MQTSEARNRLRSTLFQAGYDVSEFLLSPLQYGIPNSRLRYYLLAKLCLEVHLENTLMPPPDPLRCIPGDEGPLAHLTVRDYLEHSSSDEALYKVPDNILSRWGKVFDIVLPCSTRTCCFTRGYTQLVQGSGSILQLNEVLNTTDVFASFTKSQDISLLQPLQLRYFTPTELLRIFHFLPPNEDTLHRFDWPEGISEKTKYRLIGNSVNVEVVKRLIRYLINEF